LTRKKKNQEAKGTQIFQHEILEVYRDRGLEGALVDSRNITEVERRLREPCKEGVRGRGRHEGL